MNDRRKILAWAFYDWANSAFAVVVMGAFFPVLLKSYWSAEAPDTVSATFRLALANSTASVIVALLAPILGAIADCGSSKRRFLLFFAALGIVMTGSLHFVAEGEWEFAIALYVLAMIGFSGGNVFYDSLLIGVAGRKIDFISALGFSLGYLGGALLFALTVVMTRWPETFGLSNQTEALLASFLAVAIWWALFSVPIFLFVPDTRGPKSGPGQGAAIRSGFGQLRLTFRDIRKLKTVLLFLLAYWLYIDGVHTIMRMAVDYGMSLGFDQNRLIVALLITQFIGFPSALAFGKLGEKMGPKIGILIGIVAYIGVTVYATIMKSVADFYVLAAVIGLVQGGIQSLSRSLYARLIPPDRAGEFFGFYNMMGKFAAIIGPLLVGWVALATGSHRASIISVIILFVTGGALLLGVKPKHERKSD